MANPSKNRGTAWETAVVRYLQANGFEQAERRALAGSADKGDILACPGIILECKDHATYSDADVAEWQRQTWKEMQAANATIGILVVKRRGLVGQPGCAWAWRRGEFGYWKAQRLADAIEELRVLGWGSPLV